MPNPHPNESQKPNQPFPDPASAKGIFDESDIGSGEKTPSQVETEEMIRQIPPLPPGRQDEADEDDNQAAAATNFDAGATHGREEHDASLERDEPGENLDDLDPVPPKGH